MHGLGTTADTGWNLSLTSYARINGTAGPSIVFRLKPSAALSSAGTGPSIACGGQDMPSMAIALSAHTNLAPLPIVPGGALMNTKHGRLLWTTMYGTPYSSYLMNIHGRRGFWSLCPPSPTCRRAMTRTPGGTA